MKIITALSLAISLITIAWPMQILVSVIHAISYRQALAILTIISITSIVVTESVKLALNTDTKKFIYAVAAAIAATTKNGRDMQ